MNIVFMGTPDFAVPSLEALVNGGYRIGCIVTQPDRPKGRKRTLTPPPVKVAAQRLGLPVWQPESIKTEESIKKIQSLKPDLIITAAYGQILPRAILDAPAYGCINVHASLLPKYRGGAPIHWAIINGERETGISLMYMVEALDAGDILAQHRLPIEFEDTVGTLHDKLSVVGAQLLLASLPKLINGELKPEPQVEEEATYAPNIRREHEKIDWARSAEQIYNHIRGMNPWPVAYTSMDGKPLKVWCSEIVATDGQTETPGTIIQLEKDGILVQTGQGVLKLTEVQPAGRKRMKVLDYLRGVKLQVGMQLGDHS